MGNPNFKIRNKFEFRNSNALNYCLFRTFEIWSLGIVSRFEFRASDLPKIDQ